MIPKAAKCLLSFYSQSEHYGNNTRAPPWCSYHQHSLTMPIQLAILESRKWESAKVGCFNWVCGLDDFFFLNGHVNCSLRNGSPVGALSCVLLCYPVVIKRIKRAALSSSNVLLMDSDKSVVSTKKHAQRMYFSNMQVKCNTAYGHWVRV